MSLIDSIRLGICAQYKFYNQAKNDDKWDIFRFELKLMK